MPRIIDTLEFDQVSVERSFKLAIMPIEHMASTTRLQAENLFVMHLQQELQNTLVRSMDFLTAVKRATKDQVSPFVQKQVSLANKEARDRERDRERDRQRDRDRGRDRDRDRDRRAGRAQKGDGGYGTRMKDGKPVPCHGCGGTGHYKWECEAEHGPQVKKPAVPDPNGVGPAPIKP